ncbi:MAG: methyltransferase domain-containing protein [Candidatus Poribacteria bacterium]|nr:methyltransferase domain-containing protein [Candidatus Poribacteria bacterium]
MKTTLVIISATLLLTWELTLAQQKGEPMSDKERWDGRYDREMYIYGKEPVAFLKNKLNRLKQGKALVLAMGEGRNAVYLAQHGFDVTGVDISSIAIEKCKRLADERGVQVNTVVADLTDYDLGYEQYDLITNFYFYDKSILERSIGALKPGGMFIFEQFSVDHLKLGQQFGPKTAKYLVKPNELLEVFKSTRILYYEDTVVELDEGMHKGATAIIRLIAQKPTE